MASQSIASRHSMYLEDIKLAILETPFLAEDIARLIHEFAVGAAVPNCMKTDEIEMLQRTYQFHLILTIEITLTQIVPMIFTLSFLQPCGEF